MIRFLSVLIIALTYISSNAICQNNYFPPIGYDEWEKISPESLGWDGNRMDELYEFLADKNSKAFIILKDGRIVIEKYFDSFKQDSIWYWASAGKTLTASLVGIAQEEGYLSIHDKTSDYLGKGWTSIHQNTIVKKVNCVDSNQSCNELLIEGDSYYKFPNGNESPFSGFADPCIRKDPDSDTLWMAYSKPFYHIDGIKLTPAISINLAYSIDNGDSWVHKKILRKAVKIENPTRENEFGLYNHETFNFIPFSIDGEKKWVAAEVNHFTPQEGGFTAREGSSFHISMMLADNVSDFEKSDSYLLGGTVSKTEWNIDFYLPSLVSGMQDEYQFWNEPALYFENGKLYLILVSFSYDLNQKPIMTKNNVYVFSTEPNGEIKDWNWKFNGLLVDSLVSNELGAEAVTQTELAMSPDGQLLLLCTPELWSDQYNDFVHKGCRIIEVKSLEVPELNRDSDDNILIRGEITDSDAGVYGSAAAGYDPNLKNGIIFTRRNKGIAKLTFELWNTGLTPTKNKDTTSKEDLITIRHQLTMTTGLDYEVEDVDCTNPECLKYKADAGAQWYYHNAPYTLLEKVVENATGMNYNVFTAQSIRNKIGMNGAWIKTGFNNVYYSNPRSMARFGILMLNNGDWDGKEIIKDKNYIREMINTSQELNKSYGYLWWLNGKESYMIPGSDKVFPGDAMPDTPDDMYAALGKNGQILNVCPSKGIVIVRMGDRPDDQFFISTIFNNEIWQYLNEIMDGETSVGEEAIEHGISPNPASEYIEIRKPSEGLKPSEGSAIKIYNAFGECVITVENRHACSLQRINISNLPVGLYFIQIGNYSEKFVVMR